MNTDSSFKHGKFYLAEELRFHSLFNKSAVPSKNSRFCESNTTSISKQRGDWVSVYLLTQLSATTVKKKKATAFLTVNYSQFLRKVYLQKLKLTNQKRVFATGKILCKHILH